MCLPYARCSTPSHSLRVRRPAYKPAHARINHRRTFIRWPAQLPTTDGILSLTVLVSRFERTPGAERDHQLGLLFPSIALFDQANSCPSVI